MKGVTLCYFMCSFRYRLLFNILNSLDRVRCSIMRVHLSLIVFYAGVKTAKNGVWLTEPIFLILGRGHIHIAHHPPVPTHGPAALQPCSRSSPARYSRSLGDSKISNDFNSKKRFFNDINDLEDIEY